MHNGCYVLELVDLHFGADINRVILHTQCTLIGAARSTWSFHRRN